MCMGSTPKPPPVPMAPSYAQVEMGEDVRARDRSRRRAAAAMSTRSSMLAGDYGGGTGKTLLGM